MANLNMEFPNKGSNHAYLLLALLLIPKFIHGNNKLLGTLDARVYHECLNFVLQPPKDAAQMGIMMNDPTGMLRLCYTPIAGFIMDTPESALIAGVMGKTSSVTMASYKELGDNFRHPPRLGAGTISQLKELELELDPWKDFQEYVKQAKANWALSDPVNFLTPEPLHHWYRAFWDHDAKWCIKALGAEEIDFCFIVLQPHTGFRHVKEGIAKLKQVTGREHQDLQRYMVSLIAGAVPADFLTAIRALMDFRYLGQSTEIDEDMCQKMDDALKEFPSHKQAILDAGVHTGGKNNVLENWFIPKLEFMQSITASIRANGVAIQWSADPTEHAHITEIKKPARATNNQNYEPQICRNLDCLDKCMRFDLMTAMKEVGLAFVDPGLENVHIGSLSEIEDDLDTGDTEDLESLKITTSAISDTTAQLILDKINSTTSQNDNITTSSLLAQNTSVGHLTGSTHTTVNYFEMASQLLKGLSPTAPMPYHTHAPTTNVAYHLIRDPNFKRLKVEDVIEKYQLPDLCGTLFDYLNRSQKGDWVSSIGGRWMGNEKSNLTVSHLNVWTRVRVQQKAYHSPYDVQDPQTLNAQPPSDMWPHGYYDGALIATDSSSVWPASSIKGEQLPVDALMWHWRSDDIYSGHSIVQLRLIFQMVPSNDVRTQDTGFLTYVQRFDIVPQVNKKFSGTKNRGAYPEPSSMLYVVKQAKRSNNTAVGDIVPLDQLRSLADLMPRFESKADTRYTKANVMESTDEFWLNKYFTKELFYALHLADTQ
ncbi:hypothetical protein DXG01_014271 [Tephrocybe rancida]|nr:hypothetical protein DXG01_014271 [Tephrocybe rancida]